MMEETCAQPKKRIESDRVNHLIHPEAGHSISAISVSTVSHKKNESTPNRSISLLYPKHRPKQLKEINYAKKSKCRKKLEFSNCNMPTSFSLINLHKHFFGGPPNMSHGAEVDCLALMIITAVFAMIGWSGLNRTVHNLRNVK
jgi:hypothetical protein